MLKKDWLLLCLGNLQGDRMEPIQIQKALFKFAHESGVPSAEQYEFIAYNWGPCSFAIYDDLAELRDGGLIEFEPTGHGWNAYRLTIQGAQKTQELRRRAHANYLTTIDQVREYVTSRSFTDLLRDVYRQYPKFAERSLFRE